MRRLKARGIPPLVFAAVLTGACASTAQSDAGAGASGLQARVNRDAATLKGFQDRVNAYVELHRKLEAQLPPLPNDALPEQIQNHQRALGQSIRHARVNARAGDIFTPETRRVFRVIIGRGLRGPDGAAAKRAILNPETNPGEINHRVNAIYPDSVPVSMVPPQVLLEMPNLPEEVEFRFVARDLVLRDTHANIIVDFIPGALR